jgi:hypothetical protein
MIIYKITNLLNGKIYIGQDSKNDSNYFGSGTWILRAIKKYSKINFKKTILESCLDKNELDIKEVYWINKLESNNPIVGYNLCKGGGGTLGTLGIIVSDDTKKRMSECRRNITEETREKMRIAHIGLKNSDESNIKRSETWAKHKNDPTFRIKRKENRKKTVYSEQTLLARSLANKGKKRSENTLIKMSESQKGLKRSEETRKKISEALKKRKGLGKRDPNTNKLSYSSELSSQD